MGSHINADGEFQSDKYPTCPSGKVPLSVKDPMAQDLLWEYAQRRRSVDAEFSDDLETSLVAAGVPRKETVCFTCQPKAIGTITAPMPRIPVRNGLRAHSMRKIEQATSQELLSCKRSRVRAMCGEQRAIGPLRDLSTEKRCL
jgi:hypothetical protein